MSLSDAFNFSTEPNVKQNHSQDNIPLHEEEEDESEQQQGVCVSTRTGTTAAATATATGTGTTMMEISSINSMPNVIEDSSVTTASTLISTAMSGVGCTGGGSNSGGGSGVVVNNSTGVITLMQSSPPHSYRHSRAYRHFKNPPQPHMCIRTTTEAGEELFINVLSWTRIVIPQEPSDPIPLYGGMRVPPGSPRSPPIVFAVMANPEVLKDSGRHSKDPEERRAMVELMCDFVEAMNPGVKLVRNAVILKDRDISGELKDVWNAVQAQRDREREEQMLQQRQQQHYHNITTQQMFPKSIDGLTQTSPTQQQQHQEQMNTDYNNAISPEENEILNTPGSLQTEIYENSKVGGGLGNINNIVALSATNEQQQRAQNFAANADTAIKNPLQKHGHMEHHVDAMQTEYQLENKSPTHPPQLVPSSPVVDINNLNGNNGNSKDLCNDSNDQTDAADKMCKKKAINSTSNNTTTETKKEQIILNTNIASECKATSYPSANNNNNKNSITKTPAVSPTSGIVPEIGAILTAVSKNSSSSTATTTTVIANTPATVVTSNHVISKNTMMPSTPNSLNSTQTSTSVATSKATPTSINTSNSTITTTTTAAATASPPIKKEKLGGFLPNGCIFPRFKNSKNKDKDKEKEKESKGKDKEKTLLNALKKSKEKKVAPSEQIEKNTATAATTPISTSNDSVDNTKSQYERNCINLENEVQRLDLNKIDATSGNENMFIKLKVSSQSTTAK